MIRSQSIVHVVFLLMAVTFTSIVGNFLKKKKPEMLRMGFIPWWGTVFCLQVALYLIWALLSLVSVL